MIRNTTKQLATMTNVTTVKMSFMKTPIAFRIAVIAVAVDFSRPADVGSV
jgi:hypothetical protein